MRSAGSVVLGVLLVACGSSSTPSNTSPSEPAPAPPAQTTESLELPGDGEDAAPEMSETPTAEPVVVSIPAPVVRVKVLSTGKGKKAPLRYTMAPGATEKFRIDVESRLDAPGVPSALPALHMVYGAEVVEVAADGAMSMKLDLRDASATPVDGAILVDEMDEALRAVIGTTIEATVGAAGALDVQTYTAPSTAHDQQALIESLAEYVAWPVIVPDEPIAPGARWEVAQDIDLGGVPATIATVYELESRKGKRARIAGDVSIRTEQKTVGDLAIAKFEGSGTRSVEMVDGQLFGPGTLSQDVTLALAANGEPVEMTVGWTITTTPDPAQ